MLMNNDVLLEIKDLKISFPLDEGFIRAVEGVDLTLRRGEVLGVVGESGCGKTVTAQSILRIIPAPGRIDSGQILFHPPAASSSSNGHEVVDVAKVNPTGREIREIRGKDIAMIFQEPMSSFSPVHTIGSQIMEAILLHQSVTKEQARQQTIDLLRLVGIPGAEQRVDSYPHQFSGGMRQRAMIAMALSCNPSLLIADEPTTALDVTIQAQILDLMRDLQKRIGMAVMFITHNLGVSAKGAQFPALQFGDVGRGTALKMKNDLAFGRIEGAQDRTAGRRLAGPALSDQSQSFALKDVEANAVHCLYRSGAAAQKTLFQGKIFFEIFHLEQHAALFRHPVSPVHIRGSARNVERPAA